MRIESGKRTEELEIQHQQTLKSLQESFETKHLTERQQIELSHERELQDLRAQLSIEGKELSDRNVG